jgi:hypothetical protein
MTAFTALLKPFSLLSVCVTFIVTLAALTASQPPADAAGVTVPAAQAVPVAPAVRVAPRAEANSSLMAAAPAPVRAPAAPGVPQANAEQPTTSAGSVRVGASPLPLLAWAVAATLMAAAFLAMRRTGRSLRAAC